MSIWSMMDASAWKVPIHSRSVHLVIVIVGMYNCLLYDNEASDVFEATASNQFTELPNNT